MKIVAHFSCGATSAIATHLALEEYGRENVEIVYADTNSEHPDNARFMRDCEQKLFNKKVTVVRSTKYKTIFDVFKERRFLASPAGAPCTLEMKKVPIRNYLKTRLMTELQVFGFDAGEKKRADKYRKNNPEINLSTPLIDKAISKKDCFAILNKFDIELPQFYKLGFPNANCIGCVKAENIKYWAAIKKKFPDVFNWYAKFEREIGKKDKNGVPKGAAINKRYIKGVRHRLFLDEMPEDTEPDGQLDFFCGYSCG